LQKTATLVTTHRGPQSKKCHKSMEGIGNLGENASWNNGGTSLVIRRARSLREAQMQPALQARYGFCTKGVGVSLGEKKREGMRGALFSSTIGKTIKIEGQKTKRHWKEAAGLRTKNPKGLRRGTRKSYAWLRMGS